MELNPLSGQTEATEQTCERCGISGADATLVELDIIAPPVPQYKNDSSPGPFACEQHIETVRNNNQCCLTPDFKVHTADADAHLVEIVECKNCGEMFEFAPRPK